LCEFAPSVDAAMSVRSAMSSAARPRSCSLRESAALNMSRVVAAPSPRDLHSSTSQLNLSLF